LVLNSQDAKTLEKSLNVLKRGGKVISISGPPDPAFATKLGMNPFFKLVMRLLSRGVRSKAHKRGVEYAFLFMQADGGQLTRLTKLFESKTLVPVIDRVFPFDATNEAMAYVDTGRAKGKVVIALK
jgi:NADPH:quinone reductase-like Zn-dependent oxidoreductase